MCWYNFNNSFYISFLCIVIIIYIYYVFKSFADILFQNVQFTKYWDRSFNRLTSTILRNKQWLYRQASVTQTQQASFYRVTELDPRAYAVAKYITKYCKDKNNILVTCLCIFVYFQIHVRSTVSDVQNASNTLTDRCWLYDAKSKWIPFNSV